MSLRPPLVFKTATEDWEFEAIHRLNYKTFVEEIPQHHASPAQRLVDKFHPENTYLICLCGRKLAGMLAVRGNRPFSLDQKLDQLDSFLPPGRKVCEIRLLAVEKKFRGAQVLQGILALLWQHGIEKGYDLAIISGTPRQFKLYQHLGFVAFGPVVGLFTGLAGNVLGERVIPLLEAPLDLHPKTAVVWLAQPLLHPAAHITVSIDPAVLGGARTRIGSRVYDGTLKRQLGILRKRLAEAR